MEKNGFLFTEDSRKFQIYLETGPRFAPGNCTSVRLGSYARPGLVTKERVSNS